MSTTRTIEVPDLAATEALGRRLGEVLFQGAVVALIGPLGAGKTHFTRAVAAGLGIPERLVTSPTFVLIQEYGGGRLPVYHFDAYRLSGADSFAELGADEYLFGDGVCLIEWADRVAGALPSERLWVEVTPLDVTRRRFAVVATGAEHERLLAAFESERGAIAPR